MNIDEAAQLDVFLPHCCRSIRFALAVDGTTISTTSPSRSMSTTSPASTFAATPPEKRVRAPGGDRWATAGHRGPHRRDRLTGCRDHNASFEVGRLRVRQADAGLCPMDVPHGASDRGPPEGYWGIPVTREALRPSRPSFRPIRTRLQRPVIKGGGAASAEFMPVTFGDVDEDERQQHRANGVDQPQVAGARGS
jgi:hypothetical protein